MNLENELTNLLLSFNNQQSRPQTAPNKQLNNKEFILNDIILEEIIIEINSTIDRADQQNQNIIQTQESNIQYLREYLVLLEKMFKHLKISSVACNHREQYSLAYKLLFKEVKCIFLPEILDSCIDISPYIYVNGKQYYFRDKTLAYGEQLYIQYEKLNRLLKKAIFIENKEEFIFKLQNYLSVFQQKFIEYEELYILELMYIENQSRQIIVNAHELSYQLQQYKYSLQDQHDLQYIINLKQFISQISYINSIANIEGQGRDDLQFDIYIKAQEVLQTISVSQSKNIRSLAQQVIDSLLQIQRVLNNFIKIIETIDPQLRNNQELVLALQNYETQWTKGKNYLMSQKSIKQVIFMENFIEGLIEKYPNFNQEVQSFDSEIFIKIPMILILRYLFNEDELICCDFFDSNFINKNKEILQGLKQQIQQEIDDEIIKQQQYQQYMLNTISNSNYKITNLIYNAYESKIINNQNYKLKEIKQLGMEIQ